MYSRISSSQAFVDKRTYSLVLTIVYGYNWKAKTYFKLRHTFDNLTVAIIICYWRTCVIIKYKGTFKDNDATWNYLLVMQLGL